jgi:sensor domain CHASE-containing protein
MKPNRMPAIIVVSVIAIVGFLLWVNWYNSTDQKLQRCITAEGQEWEHQVQTDPQAQVIHNAGGDPPMALSILDCDDKLGIKP